MSSATADLPVMLLIGGGHAHLHVLESLRKERWPRVRTILLTPYETHIYSGMTPGFLQDQYASEELTIDLGPLCRAAGVELVVGTADTFDSTDREVHSSAGVLPYTIASLDIGSVPQGLDLPGVREHASTLRPMQAAMDLRRRLDELGRTSAGGPVRVGVVGGGAGGVEVTLAAASRLLTLGAIPRVSIIERAGTVLEGYPAAARAVAEKLVRGAGGELRTGCEVERVEPDRVVLSNGENLELDLVIWVSGAAPPPLLAASSLPRSDDGYFAVDGHLRAIDGSPVWGAGDCIALEGHSLAKAGVYAVRQAPTLAANLRAALTGAEPRAYRPQTTFLSLLNSGDGRALLRWRQVVLHNRAAWWLKDRIDRRFVDRYKLP